MFQLNDRVKYKDANLNNIFGILTILSIKGDSATCSKLDYNNIGSLLYNIKLDDLEKTID
jgi:hypothetical protein